MPQAKYGGIDFPYVEGLRLDEAMNPLTLLCVGMYGETLPNQDGAPVRMVIPWKYGYKSIKSLVKIRFVRKKSRRPPGIASSDEYGFYSNVNPNVDHPRWSQAKERRLGEIFTRNTLMFNGYGDQVASHLQRHGPEEISLEPESCMRAILTSKWTKVVVFLLCLVPFAGLV